MLKTKNVLMFVVLSAGMLTALTATMMSQAIPAFADKKKCEDNDNNNCNDSHKTQKIDQKNKCETENENNHHSKRNDNSNEQFCENLGVNVKDVFVLLGF
jgi:flagellar basal body L-ring protein FlgH